MATTTMNTFLYRLPKGRCINVSKGNQLWTESRANAIILIESDPEPFHFFPFLSLLSFFWFLDGLACQCVPSPMWPSGYLIDQCHAPTCSPPIHFPHYFSILIWCPFHP
ncbi:hypothetical protein FRB91_006466 [Serendipita sp. 411]|nr:hypothetical protein FRB91_006466 [Serendipita sp. 411]